MLTADYVFIATPKSPVRDVFVICRGGIRLIVRGTALDSVAEPKLVLMLPGDHVYVVSRIALSRWILVLYKTTHYYYN